MCTATMFRRVNFYIDELYGNPTHAENRNAYNTTLGVFVSKLPMSELKLFNHPVVIYATDLKWKQFGRTQFLKCGIPSLPSPLCLPGQPQCL